MCPSRSGCTERSCRDAFRAGVLLPIMEQVWEVAVLFHLRDAFRSGDIWLRHSRMRSPIPPLRGGCRSFQAWRLVRVSRCPLRISGHDGVIRWRDGLGRDGDGRMRRSARLLLRRWSRGCRSRKLPGVTTSTRTWCSHGVAIHGFARRSSKNQSLRSFPLRWCRVR